MKTINALMQSFCYMLAQCKQDMQKIEINLDSVYLHQFGEHKQCGEWCHIKGNPEAMQASESALGIRPEIKGAEGSPIVTIQGAGHQEA